MPCYNYRCTNRYHLSQFIILEKSDTDNIQLVSAAETTVFQYMLVNEITPTEAPDFLANEYLSLVISNDNNAKKVNIINRRGNKTCLETSPLDPTDDIIDAGLGAKWLEAQRSFFRRKFFRAPTPYIIPYVHPKNIDLWLLTVNIVGARLPEVSKLWPRQFAANDNIWALPTPANDL